MASTTKSQSLRRRTWGLRMALWSGLLVILVIVFIVSLLRGLGSGDGTSKFPSIHKFDTVDYHSLAFSPRAGVLLFGHHNGLQMSEDGGSTWREVINQPGWDILNLVYDPFSPDRIYMAGHNLYHRSDDGGKTWAKVENNLPGLDLHAFTASSRNEGRLYAFAVGLGLFVSEDGGNQWQLLSADVPLGTLSVIELPDGALLLAAVDGGLLRSEDGGKTWIESRTGIASGVTIYTVKSDPEGQRAYAGTNKGLFVSTDGGRTWGATSLDDTTLLVVGVNPANPLEVMAINSGGRLFRSRDGGMSW